MSAVRDNQPLRLSHDMEFPRIPMVALEGVHSGLHSMRGGGEDVVEVLY